METTRVQPPGAATFQATVRILRPAHFSQHAEARQPFAAGFRVQDNDGTDVLQGPPPHQQLDLFLHTAYNYGMWCQSGRLDPYENSNYTPSISIMVDPAVVLHDSGTATNPYEHRFNHISFTQYQLKFNHNHSTYNQHTTFIPIITLHTFNHIHSSLLPAYVQPHDFR
jgi:hypothetical protein